MNANELAKFIAELIFDEKEMILEAIENEDAQMLVDGIYEYIQNCE